MHFLRKQQGQNAVEWLVVVIIIVAVLGGIILSIATALSDKLTEYHDAL